MYTAMAAYYDVLFPLNPAIPAFLDGFLDNRPARILDIGCGTGTYTAAMATHNDAIGIDPSGPLIQRARQNHPDVPFQETDLSKADLNPGFDLIYCIGNVIAHIPDKELGDFVQRVYDLLRPGGIWVFHTMNWDAILATGEGPAFPEIARPGVRFSRRYTHITPERVQFETCLETSEGVARQSATLYPLLQKRIDALHTEFHPVASASDYVGSPLTDTASARIYAYAR